MIAFCRSIYTLCRNRFAVTVAAHQLISSACNAKQIEKVECNSNGQSADQHLAVQTANLLLRCEHLVGPQLHYTKHNVPLSIFCAIFWLLIFAFFAFRLSFLIFYFCFVYSARLVVGRWSTVACAPLIVVVVIAFHVPLLTSVHCWLLKRNCRFPALTGAIPLPL